MRLMRPHGGARGFSTGPKGITPQQIEPRHSIVYKISSPAQLSIGSAFNMISAMRLPFRLQHVGSWKMPTSFALQ